MASAEIRGEFFQIICRMKFAEGFLLIWGAVFLGNNRRNKSIQKSTVKFKSEFGSFRNFEAKIHTLQRSGRVTIPNGEDFTLQCSDALLPDLLSFPGTWFSALHATMETGAVAVAVVAADGSA